MVFQRLVAADGKRRPAGELVRVSPETRRWIAEQTPAGRADAGELPGCISFEPPPPAAPTAKRRRGAGAEASGPETQPTVEDEPGPD